MLEKYPFAAKEIQRALDSTKIPQLSTERAQELLNADQLLLKYSTRVNNESYSRQTDIRKVLVEEAAGDETDYESDVEELTEPETDPSER